MKQNIKTQLRADREWLRLSDTAYEISETLGEEFDAKEILSLCMDGFLILSVIFATGVLIRPGKLVDFGGVEWDYMPETGSRYMTSVKVSDKEYINFTDEAYPIKGVYDLPMIGMERQFVSGMIDTKRGIVSPSQLMLGAFVVDPKDRTNIFQIITVFDEPRFDSVVPALLGRLTSTGEILDGCFEPAQLPEYAELVIRREPLTQFKERIMSKFFDTNSYGNDAILRIERNNEFNQCIEAVVNEFKGVNGYLPTTPDEILCRMIKRPPKYFDVKIQNHQIIVNNSNPKDIANVKRNINNFLNKAKLKRPY